MTGDQEPRERRAEGADRWAEQLSALRVETAPARSMLGEVAPRVRRRRSLRRAGVLGGVAGLVAAAVMLPATLLSGPDRDAEPAPAPPPAGESFSCPLTADELLADEPWPDVEQQRLNADNVATQVDWRDFVVEHAEASPVGVVALVRGDLGAARRVLPAYGVEVVVPVPADGDVAKQVTTAVRAQVDELAQNLRRGLEPSLGAAEVETAPAAGRVLVRTTDPAPPALAMLDGVRQGGLGGGSVGIEVVAARYAPDVVEGALDRLSAALPEIDGELAVLSARSCADASGLVVLAVPPLGDRTALEARLSAAAGIPVTVRAESALNGERRPEA